MTDTEKVLLYTKVLNAWGVDTQIRMVMEESGEMLAALGKAARGRVTQMDVITELADVSIMMEQMAVFFGLDEFRVEKERKLQRLQQRLKEWEEKQNGTQS